MSHPSPLMEERAFRSEIQKTLTRVEKAFENIDPDLAECSQGHGALTIEFPDGSRCILSAQPSVRQLWMAVAARGVAFHFNWDPTSLTWRDDKGRPIELFSYLETYLKEVAKVSVTFETAVQKSLARDISGRCPKNPNRASAQYSLLGAQDLSALTFAAAWWRTESAFEFSI